MEPLDLRATILHGMYRTSWLLLLFLCTCGPAQETPTLHDSFPVATPHPAPRTSHPGPRTPPTPHPDHDTTQWTELIHLAPTIELEIRYATTDNFMEQVIYDCARCFYRPEVAQALADIQQELALRGLGLKMYDCYRPRPYQQRLWDVMPDARYVARPERGSVHSRGAAADLTLINLDTGVELDMGTPYDFFGERAYTTTTDLPAEVLQNRAILQDVMQRRGFATIRTEWWHFNFTGPRYELSDWVWPCE